MQPVGPGERRKKFPARPGHLTCAREWRKREERGSKSEGEREEMMMIIEKGQSKNAASRALLCAGRGINYLSIAASLCLFRISDDDAKLFFGVAAARSLSVSPSVFFYYASEAGWGMIFFLREV